MKRALIRVLYGEPKNVAHDHCECRSRIDKDIRSVINRKGDEDFVVYCFGEANYKFVKDLGHKNVVLADKNVWIDGEVPFSFLNKIHAWEYALQDYDEIVYLDWDTIQIKPFPPDFWDILASKESIQSCLARYHKGVLSWRRYRPDRANKLVSSGCFVYIRDKEIPGKLLKLADDPLFNENIYYPKKRRIPGIISPKQWSDEIYISKYTDSICGGWDGVEKYFKLFEPKWCLVEKPQFLEDKQDACFKHPVKGKEYVQNCIACS